MDVRVGPRRPKVALGRRPAGRSEPAKRSESVIAQLSSLLRALGTSRYRRRLGLLAAGIVLVICANSVGQIRLNAWQGATRSSSAIWRISALSCWCSG
jgi:hypothetical protein